MCGGFFVSFVVSLFFFASLTGTGASVMCVSGGFLFCYLQGFSFPQAGPFSCRMRLSRTSPSAWLPRPERDGIAEFKTKCFGYPDAENT